MNLHKKKNCHIGVSPDMTVRDLTKLDGTVDLAGSHALRANIGSSDRTVIIDSDRLDVGIPLSSRMSIRMGYLISGNLTLSANFTLSEHLPHLLSSYSKHRITPAQYTHHTHDSIAHRTAGVQVFFTILREIFPKAYFS